MELAAHPADQLLDLDPVKAAHDRVVAHAQEGNPLAIQGFTALVIGGVGRVEGALLGGLLLAFAEQMTIRYAPIPSGYAQGVPLLLSSGPSIRHRTLFGARSATKRWG